MDRRASFIQQAVWLYFLFALIVTKGIHDRFVDALTERMKTLVVDDALKAGTHVGPVVDQSQLDQDLRYIALGKDEGAKLHWGGEILNRDKGPSALIVCSTDGRRQ